MVIIFVIVCLIIAFLIFLMFKVLKKTVEIVNSQTKSYFINKLQGYDDLIERKENKLQEIDNLIKDKEKDIGENSQEKNKNIYDFDMNVIDLLNATKYQNGNVFELNKKIDESFAINYDSLIHDFLTLCEDSTNYDFCLNLRKKFNSDTIYKLKSTIPDDMEDEIKSMLNKKEYKVYETFKLLNTNFSIESFVDYLDQLVDLNNPKVLILVGNKSENYDHLGKNIETVFDEKIYRGIKIIYRGKIYDFSLSERNV